jgi:uncharacterized protein YqfA (UPF0365 family)
LVIIIVIVIIIIIIIMMFMPLQPYLPHRAAASARTTCTIPCVQVLHESSVATHALHPNRCLAPQKEPEHNLDLEPGTWELETRSSCTL